MVVYVITAVPADIPVTTPVNDPTVATVVLPLVQVPPGTVSVNAVVSPTQIFNTPSIGPGGRFTVSTKVTLQPDMV